MSSLLTTVYIFDDGSASDLERCVRALKGSNDCSFAITCITAGSSAVNLLSGRHPDIEIVRLTGMKAPEMYNCAYRHVLQRGDKWFAMVHSTIEVDGDWLPRSVEIAAMDKRIAFIGLMIRAADGEGLGFSGGAFHKAWGIWEAGRGYCGEGKAVRYAYYIDPRACLCNGELLPAIGFFDEALGPRGAAVDICYRAWTKGMETVRNPGATARRIGAGAAEGERGADSAASRVALQIIIKNYQLRTIRKFLRPIIGYYLKNGETRSFRAVVGVLLRIIPLLVQRASVQMKRTTPDERIFELVDNRFAPYSALLTKRDHIIMGEDDEDSLLRGWSTTVRAEFGGKREVYRFPLKKAGFQLFAHRRGPCTVGIEAAAAEDPVSGRLLVNGRFAGNIHLKVDEQKQVEFRISPEWMPGNVLNGEIQLRYGWAAPGEGPGGNQKGLMVRKIWLTEAKTEPSCRKTGLRVLMTGYDDFAGPGMKHLYRFANIMQRHGFNVLALHPEDPKSCLIMDEPAAFDFWDISFKGPSLSRETAEMIRRFNPQIIHLWTPRHIPSLVGIEAKKVSDGRLIIHYEDNEQVIFDEWYKGQVKKQILSAREVHSIHPETFSLINELADCYTAICHPLREFLLREYGKPTFMLYPGADLKRFRPMDKDPDLTEKYHLQGRTVLMYTGNIHPPNFDDFCHLLGALAILEKKYPDVLLIYCGLNHVRGPVEEKIRELGIEEKVLYLGVIDFHDIHRHLSLADVLVQPGQNNAFNEYRLPSKIPEYFAMGKPVVMFSIGIGEVLTDHEEVLKLQRGDAGELAAKIEELILNESLRARLGRGARRKAEELFDWEKNAQGLMRVYEELACSG